MHTPVFSTRRGRILLSSPFSPLVPSSAHWLQAVADWIGRRSTVIVGCAIFSVGVIFQVASTTVALLGHTDGSSPDTTEKMGHQGPLEQGEQKGV